MNALIILLAIMTFVLITADPYRDEPPTTPDRDLTVQQSEKKTHQTHQNQNQNQNHDQDQTQSDFNN